MIASDMMFQMELMFRIILATIFGLIIGQERKSRNKSAGVRTHAIVALGAALIMIVSKYGFTDIPSYDAARVAAQVVSGVGFLGAGIIFVRNNLVNGLTTAAGMWATAGLGLALGSGMYVVGICTGVLVILMQYIFHRVSYFSQVALGGFIRLSIAQKPGAVMEMTHYLEGQKVVVASVKINKNKKDEIKLEYEVVYPPGFDKSELLARLVEKEDVFTASE